MPRNYKRRDSLSAWEDKKLSEDMLHTMLEDDRSEGLSDQEDRRRLAAIPDSASELGRVLPARTTSKPKPKAKPKGKAKPKAMAKAKAKPQRKRRPE